MGRAQNFHFSYFLFGDGWARDVRIVGRDGLCALIETGVAPNRGDECHSAAIPGLPNLHSHAFQRGMAGMAEKRGPSSDSFWTWREAMYRFVDRVGPEEIEAIAALAYMEMLETGFTRVGEFHYLHHDRNGRPFGDPGCMSIALANAASEVGIALTLLPVFYAHAGFGGASPGAGQRRFVCDIEQFGRLFEAIGKGLTALPDFVLGIAPHSLRAVTPDELRALLDLATSGPIHIHIAEQIREVDECMAWSGARPVEWLLENNPVDQRWCLVHATHMTDVEARKMAQTRAIAGLCPITEANLGDGFFNVEPFLGAGGRYGIGSDSNVLIDATEELRLLEYGQRLQRHGRNLLASAEGASTGQAIFCSALAGGAQALGAASDIAVGQPLDFVTLDTSHPSLVDRADRDLLDSWIFAAGRGAIDSVWRRGEKLVSSGRHRLRQKVEERYRKVMKSLMS